MWVAGDVSHAMGRNMSRIVDLDVDIGADAVDYKYVLHSVKLLVVLLTMRNSAIANQESLSSLEVEMRKLEGIIKEVVDEMGFLKTREERFADTNGQLASSSYSSDQCTDRPRRIHEQTRSQLCPVQLLRAGSTRGLANTASPRILQAQVSHRLSANISMFQTITRARRRSSIKSVRIPPNNNKHPQFLLSSSPTRAAASSAKGRSWKRRASQG